MSNQFMHMSPRPVFSNLHCRCLCFHMAFEVWRWVLAGRKTSHKFCWAGLYEGASGWSWRVGPQNECSSQENFLGKVLVNCHWRSHFINFISSHLWRFVRTVLMNFSEIRGSFFWTNSNLKPYGLLRRTGIKNWLLVYRASHFGLFQVLN